MIPDPRPELAAILFDMDGTLVDTEAESGQALAQVFERRYGVELGATALDEVVGAAWDDAIERLHMRYEIQEADLQGLRSELLQAKEGILADRLKVLPAAAASIEVAASRWPVAVITGSWHAEADYALAELGVTSMVKFIIGSEEVREGKPAPEGYLAAASRLGVPARACLVLEDSVRGVRSAHRAGAFVVGVRVGSFNPDKLQAAGADVVIDSLDELPTPEAFEALYASGKT